MKKLRIAIAQINPIAGDLSGNLQKIISWNTIAREQHQADLVVFPEMALTGYPINDLLFSKEFWRQFQEALRIIRARAGEGYMILGLPVYKNRQYFNAAVLLHEGKIVATYIKNILFRNHSMDESRYFTPGQGTTSFKLKGVKIALSMGEDIKVFDGRIELLISLDATPFVADEASLRRRMLASCACRQRCGVMQVNLVGGQDDLIFAGGSMVFNANGALVQRAPFFKEELLVLDWPHPKSSRINKAKKIELIYDALVLGVRDYVLKNGFEQVLVSVSGGIDSVLTLAIVVDALGKECVKTCYLPSRFSSKLSQAIVRQQAKLLGVTNATISIEPLFKKYLEVLDGQLGKPLNSITLANLQARCRATIIMALANEHRAMVINTSNKSETAVGYTTLYGDMVGGFAPLKDVTKTLVYELANYRNSISIAIPQAAIERVPTAELAKNQRDEDDLPPYSILDEIIVRLVELGQTEKQISEAGFDRNTVREVAKMIGRSEYKRRQAPLGPKITTSAFGSDIRYPTTSKFKYG
jgi:NAD+ synthase (glutamine-hydrolysing)